MDGYITGSGNPEKISLSDCFTHEQAIENYRLFLCYYTGTREFMLHQNLRYRSEFLQIARVAIDLLHLHYDPTWKIRVDIFKMYNATDVCQRLKHINEYRKTCPFYLRTSPTERAYLDLFVHVLLQWIYEVLPITS
ncbi:hypothetical protein ACTJJ0_12430 [Chitinophaga sp. 22321]|uniref:Uncharacterized protein n=1 Tax=Chitinophaga hostae TaxID=2831022 RepID=A0ABS5IWM1_9BACT|nr:hypothetical protein [Chitinophaga hostae]MBS0027265.1 hypothetical protein [Chitinophaga hostae]